MCTTIEMRKCQTCGKKRKCYVCHRCKVRLCYRCMGSVNWWGCLCYNCIDKEAEENTNGMDESRRTGR